MLNYMDVDIQYGMPGGDGFEDVTSLFVVAAKDMASEELLMTDGFTLMDAMSAFEIGEPRMDSGMTLEQDVGDSFESLAPLLPGELCWIMDRMFACEMEWHAGNSLSQSVYTLLYVHQLADINPDLLPSDYSLQYDPGRPIELITMVLRAAAFGLLKCCDLVWRELSKKRVYDVEDWQSDKCDVTLLEGVPIEVVIRKIDDAHYWLRHSHIPDPDKDALCDRLLLRKRLLELFRFNQAADFNDLLPLVTLARNALRKVQSKPYAAPGSGSPALNAFDPRVTRRLHTIVPIRVLELPAQEVVWQSLGSLMDGWEHITRLREIHSLKTWKVAGLLNAWESKLKPKHPYIRSFTQAAFCDRSLVLGEYPLTWLINQFFEETVGIPYQHIVNQLPSNWVGHGRWTMKDVETQIVRTVVNFIKVSWFNPPRRRRALMKSITDWQMLHEALLTMSTQIAVDDHEDALIAVSLPRAAALWKLTVAEEIILSGFQLQLYAPHERSVAYWLLAHVLEQHLDCLETLRSFISSDSPACKEMHYQSRFLTALQLMSMALCALTARDLTQPFERMTLNFTRRYKWIPFDEAGSLLLPLPSFLRFPWDLKSLFEDETFVPLKHLQLAQSIFLNLTQWDTHVEYGQEESIGQVNFLDKLASVAGQLATELRHADASTPFVWDPVYHPWFPRCLS